MDTDTANEGNSLTSLTRRMSLAREGTVSPIIREEERAFTSTETLSVEDKGWQSLVKKEPAIC